MASRTSTTTEIAHSARLKKQAERLKQENLVLRASLRAVREQLQQERARARQVSGGSDRKELQRIEPAAGAVTEMQEVGLMFLHSELQLAETFLRIAKQASAPEKRERNVHNAHIAYDSVRRYYRKKLVTKQTAKKIDRRIAAIREALQRLGEGV